MIDMNFNDWLTAQQLTLKAFGKYFVEEMTARVKVEIGDDRYKTFFKIEPNFRSKEIKSALNKQSNKNYTDPCFQMTDLVGARFVVLLRSDISIVERVLINCSSLWTARRDREPKSESDKMPDAFRYQSVHYIVRNINDFTYDGVLIPSETACEVQIRTLLQHAYAELGHDRIYKSAAIVPPNVHRIVAKSMALMETADDLFCEAVEELNRINKNLVQWGEWLDNSYSLVGSPSLLSMDDDDAILIIETYLEILLLADSDQVISCFNQFALSSIKSRRGRDDLFGRPVVLLVYWLMNTHFDQTIYKWPLPKFRHDLETVAADLGIALD